MKRGDVYSNCIVKESKYWKIFGCEASTSGSLLLSSLLGGAELCQVVPCKSDMDYRPIVFIRLY